ncbi:uncharacterized protein LOC6548162 [Drosophila erecta]|uniref:HSF-type DNA-binding domain-containing protein n=1 Tax=Drosophila erecta TaxID=7220 RepID=B3NN99_DROER|nr:uncharacterized protein LOC6548162 [Drosophila erecta]EDV55523.2 uncharacterized protein Dere_GG20736 [Drosophila erecta]
MPRSRSNLRQPPIVNESAEESADEFEESAATSWKNECKQLEARSPPESPEYLHFMDSDDPLDEIESNPLQEQEPLDLAIKTDSTINKEAKENHMRIYRQLGIHIPESPAKHPLLDYSFVVKLFLVTDCSSIHFLKWSASGRELEVDYQGMQEHLSSGCSVFHSRNTLQFTGSLLAHGFERVWSKDVRKSSVRPTSISLIFRNPNFVRGQLQKLQKLVQEFGKVDEISSAETEEPRHPNNAHIARMVRRGDLCSTSYTCRSALQVARCHFQTLLGYQADMGVLKDRNSHDVFNKHIMTQLNVKRGRSSINNAPVDLAPSKVSFAKFVKPHESVINIGIGQAPDYAGYYGKVELSKVNDFFSEYLPRYGSKITGYKDIVMDATNKSIGFQQNLPIGMNYSDDEDDVLPPISSDHDLDFMPSTSAAAKPKSSGGKVVEDSDLEQAMQELCGGPNLNEEDELPQTSSRSTARLKAKPKPKPRAKAKATKRQSKPLHSSSSEGEDYEVDEEEFTSRKPKNVKFNTRDHDTSYSAEVDTDSEEQVFEETTDTKLKDTPYDDNDNDDDDGDEDEGGEEEEEDFLDEDDEDYIDKNIQYRSAPEPPKSRRYDLRNAKRNPR